MSRGLSVRFVPDQFRLHGVGAAHNVNFVILMRSFLELQKVGPEQVVVFDRFVLDDYIFMWLLPDSTGPRSFGPANSRGGEVLFINPSC